MSYALQAAKCHFGSQMYTLKAKLGHLSKALIVKSLMPAGAAIVAASTK